LFLFFITRKRIVHIIQNNIHMHIKLLQPPAAQIIYLFWSIVVLRKHRFDNSLVVDSHFLQSQLA